MGGRVGDTTGYIVETVDTLSESDKSGAFELEGLGLLVVFWNAVDGESSPPGCVRAACPYVI